MISGAVAVLGAIIAGVTLVRDRTPSSTGIRLILLGAGVEITTLGITMLAVVSHVVFSPVGAVAGLVSLAFGLAFFYGAWKFKIRR